MSPQLPAMAPSAAGGAEEEGSSPNQHEEHLSNVRVNYITE